MFAAKIRPGCVPQLASRNGLGMHTPLASRPGRSDVYGPSTAAFSHLQDKVFCSVLTMQSREGAASIADAVSLLVSIEKPNRAVEARAGEPV